MSSRELLRVGLIMLGAFLIVSASESLVDNFARNATLLTSNKRSASELLQPLLLLAALSVGASLILGILPGALLIVYSRQWAAWLVSTPVAVSSPSGSALLPVALIILGLVLAVHGLAGLVGALAFQAGQGAAQFEALAEGIAWQHTASSLVQLLAGSLVFAWGRQAARNAA